jgi:hypothetical protein
MKAFDTILYETPAEHVARIVLNRRMEGRP